MRPYLAILRPNNILLTLFTQGVFMIAASRTSYFTIDWTNIIWPESVLIILTCCLTAAGGYIINDLFDVETDHINRPNKRILKRDISHKAAIVYYIILTAIGQICGYYAGLGIGLFASAIAVLLYFYSSDLKAMGLPGNSLIAFMSGSVIYIASRGIHEIHSAYFAEYAFLAFLLTMARELMKDAEDIEGDKEQDCETFPILHGTRKTNILSNVILALIVIFLVTAAYLLSIEPFLNIKSPIEIHHFLFPTFLLMGLVPMILKSMWMIAKANKKRDYKKISKWLKLTMLVGLISVLFSAP
ncbi:prenyltransferase [Bacteroidota bacterium]|nr:prenyltransferase [Bacteroidota bacterium]